jgi:hypothetical protein
MCPCYIYADFFHSRLTTRRLGRDSRWWGYLQSLPQTRVDLAGFWPLEMGNDDIQEASKWLQGTELMKHIKEEASSTLVSESN